MKLWEHSWYWHLSLSLKHPVISYEAKTYFCIRKCGWQSGQKPKKKKTRSADLCLLGHELLSEYPSVSNRRPRHDKKPDIFINVKSHFHIYSSFIIEAPCQVS